MNKTLTLLFNILILSTLQGQSLSEKIAIDACKYLDSINDINILQDSIRGSITKSMTNVMMEASLEERKQITTVEGIRGTIKKAYDILPSYCYNVRRLVIENKKTKLYGLSSNFEANKYFDKGNEYLDSKKFKKAIKEFKSAIKLDPNFVYAIDHLAISYRRQEDYKSAVKYYKKSLEVFPEGNVALLNIAVCYSNLEDDENSIKNYAELKFLYPNDPEGYFGLAKMLSIKEDYENALDNLFIAHRIYLEADSEYQKDSQKLFEFISAKLEELGKSELIERKAKENNITIKE